MKVLIGVGGAGVEALLARAAERGVAHTTTTRQGNPEREIIRLAAAERVDLIVIDAGIIEETPHGPGKHPLGRIARFVVDHALCDVLLVRRFAAPDRDWLPPNPPPHGPKHHD